MEERILYFDCLSGISGDMTLATLLDLGVEYDYLLDELKKLNVDGFDIEVRKDLKNGISGTNVFVHLDNNHDHDHDHDHHSHRNLYDIEKIINDSKLNENVKNLSIKIFKEVALAEAKIHGKDLYDVHFHEVGAIDSIVDIVGAAICIDKLNVDKIYSSPIHIGTGHVKCAHGNIPIPAPATLEILKGIKIYSKGIDSELVTPTGAAIIKTIADDFLPIPEMYIEDIGYGIGKKDLNITNVLRTFIGKKKLKKI